LRARRARPGVTPRTSAEFDDPLDALDPASSAADGRATIVERPFPTDGASQRPVARALASTRATGGTVGAARTTDPVVGARARRRPRSPSWEWQ